VPRGKNRLEGVQVLVPLPTKSDYSIDFEGMKDNVRYLVNAGVHGVIALGSTGEFFQLSATEFDKVADTVVEATDGKASCTIGCSYQNLDECLRRTKYAERAGADGAMIMPPYYLPLTQEAALDFYTIIDGAVDNIQIMAYNFPPASRINLAPELWEKLVELPSITAVKESNSDIFHVTRVLSRVGSKVSVLAGSEAWLLPETILGAKGVTSIFGTGLPRYVLDFYDACKKGDLARAVPMHKAFAEASWFITPFNEVAWVKGLAAICGRHAGPPRPPYAPLGKDELRFLSDWVKAREAENPTAAIRTSG
jgi:4-hydroxy-tetrahydrodipicolinate synthase